MNIPLNLLVGPVVFGLFLLLFLYLHIKASNKKHQADLEMIRNNTLIINQWIRQMQPQNLEQYTMKKSPDYLEVLESIDLKELNVLEFGVGEGALSKMIWDQNPRSWLGYEIDNRYGLVPTNNHQLMVGDFTQANFDWLCTHWCFISNPPYSKLQFIEDNILSKVYDAIIMIPQSKRDKYVLMGFRTVATLEGSDFIPASEGKHLVMRRGFFNA